MMTPKQSYLRLPGDAKQNFCEWIFCNAVTAARRSDYNLASNIRSRRMQRQLQMSTISINAPRVAFFGSRRVTLLAGYLFLFTLFNAPRYCAQFRCRANSPLTAAT
jgi:hypothetical protein